MRGLHLFLSALVGQKSSVINEWVNSLEDCFKISDKSRPPELDCTYNRTKRSLEDCLTRPATFELL